MRASAWRVPAVTLIIAAAVLGQHIRTPELVVSARQLDAEAWQIVLEIVASFSAGARNRGRVFL